MYYKEHLAFSGLINSIFLFILYHLLGTDIFRDELIIPLVATFYIFSILPDIDHPNSHVSGILYLFLIYLFGSSAYDFYHTLNSLSFLKMGLAVLIFITHLQYAEDSYLHRRFPHTFTFGVVTCLVLYFLTSSILVTMVGVISFVTHLIADGHVDQALERDRKIWSKILSK